jgi:hypothetical protein
MNKFPTFNNKKSDSNTYKQQIPNNGNQTINNQSNNNQSYNIKNQLNNTKNQLNNNKNQSNNRDNLSETYPDDYRSGISSDYNLDDESMISLSSDINDKNIESYTNQNNKQSQLRFENTAKSNVSTFKKPMDIPKDIDFGVDIIANPNHVNAKDDLNDNISVHSGLSGSVNSLYLNRRPDYQIKKDQTIDEILQETDNSIANNKNNNFFNETLTNSNENNNNYNYNHLEPNFIDNNVDNSNNINLKIKQQTNKNIHSNYHKYAELTPHEIFDKKEEILIELEKLEEKGIKSEKKFNIQSDLYEMERCYLRLKRRRDQDIAVKLMRKVLLTFVTGTEYMTESFLSESIHLDGWSESVLMNIVDYDEVFEELYDKYSSKFAVSPEIKLMIMLVGSAFTFHMTKMLTGGFVKQSNNFIPPFVNSNQSSNNSKPNKQNANNQNVNNVNTENLNSNNSKNSNPIFNLFNVMNDNNVGNNKQNNDLDDIMNEINANNLEIPDDISVISDNNSIANYKKNNKNVYDEILDQSYTDSDSDSDSGENDENDENVENSDNSVNKKYDEIISNKNTKSIIYDEIISNNKNKQNNKPKIKPKSKENFLDEILSNDIDSKTLVL